MLLTLTLIVSHEMSYTTLTVNFTRTSTPPPPLPLQTSTEQFLLPMTDSPNEPPK